MKFFGKGDTTVTITTRTIIKSIVLAIAAYILLQMISNVTHQLRLIGVSAFLALALSPAVNWIARHLKSKSRVRATGVAYVLVLLFLIGFLSLVVPPLVKQTSDFVHDIPQTINDFKNQDSALARAVRKYDVGGRLDDIKEDLTSQTGNYAKPVVNTAGRVVGNIISMITVLVLTFMMLVEGPLWFERLMAIQEEEKQAKYRSMAQRMYRVVTGYVNGQVLIAAIAGTFAAVMLFIASSILNVSINPIALAGIVFVFGLIPLIGNTLAAVIVVLACLLASSGLAIIMAGYFLLYQQIENATLQPYIQSKSNELTPLTVFIAALLGAGLAGLLGALAAIPIAGCIRIILNEQIKLRFPDLKSAKHDKR